MTWFINCNFLNGVPVTQVLATAVEPPEDAPNTAPEHTSDMCARAFPAHS